ncbi:MAG TPA: tetraacyldisaccharide 4'-kinase [Candidatus Saccharimonadales bacterium]|jgi:tetraacyldisaccharide 4'-kinase|nr:tetraacyldisaccharide 4'-kinase [Candidatus Saccharimonadales bacterium]
MNPLAVIFGGAVAVRNALYDRQIWKTHRLARPVVSVGNLSTGGSGKTPFVIALGELLKERGIEFDVLSRGYGRLLKQIAVVDPQGEADEFGDEPLLIARKLQVPVIVGADRYQAGLMAEKQFTSRLHLLDDGFQHRRLHRDFDILMLPARDLQADLLPTGRLREPLTAMGRADAVVLESGVPAPTAAARVWRVSRETTVDSRFTGSVIAFCGIAHPDQFFTSLQAAGVKVLETVAFRDHHRYGQRDIERLLQLKAKTGATGFITTEKDAIRLKRFPVELQPLHAAELKLRIEDASLVVEELLGSLNDLNEPQGPSGPSG